MGRVSDAEFNRFISKWDQIRSMTTTDAYTQDLVEVVFEPSRLEALEWTTADIHRFCFLPLITAEEVREAIADIDTVCRRLQEDSK